MISSGASCLTSNFRGVYIRFVNIPPFTVAYKSWGNGPFFFNISSRARWHNFGLSHRRRRRGWNVIWMFPKIGGFSPNHPLKNRVFHEINHPFWGIPIFGNTHIDSWNSFGWSLRDRSLSFFRLPNRIVFLGVGKRVWYLPPDRTRRAVHHFGKGQDEEIRRRGNPAETVLKREATKTLRFPCLKKFLARKNGYTWWMNNLRTTENEWMGNYRT